MKERKRKTERKSSKRKKEGKKERKKKKGKRSVMDELCDGQVLRR